MKTKLFTKNLCLGLMMTFVLMLGVQGTAGALTLTPKSNLVQSKRGVTGVDFEIEFSVSKVTSKLKTGYKKRQSSSPHYDQTEPYYDNTTTGQASGWEDHETTGYGTTFGLRTLKRGGVDWYYTVTRTGAGTTGHPYAYTYTSYTSQGVALDAPTLPADYFTSTDARTGNAITPIHNSDNKFSESEAHYFNDEAIAITVGSNATTYDLRLDSGALVNVPDTKVRATGEMATRDNASLFERAGHQDLRLSPSNSETISLTFTPETPTVGTFMITVTDVTPVADFPSDQSPREQDEIIFTLYSTTEDPDIDGKDALNIFTQASTRDQRVDTGEKIETVSARFKVVEGTDPTALASTDTDVRIRYRIISGSGKLYIGTIQDQFTTPTQDMTAHQSVDVFLITNRTTNEVSASIAGTERQRFASTITYQYTGSDRSDDDDDDDDDEDPPPPLTTRTITVSPSSISGEAGTTQRLTVSAGTAIVRVEGDTAFQRDGGSISGTGSTRSITLPDSPGSTYTLTLSASRYEDRTVSVAVTAPTPGTLTLTTVGSRSGT